MNDNEDKPKRVEIVTPPHVHGDDELTATEIVLAGAADNEGQRRDTATAEGATEYLSEDTHKTAVSSAENHNVEAQVVENDSDASLERKKRSHPLTQNLLPLSLVVLALTVIAILAAPFFITEKELEFKNNPAFLALKPELAEALSVGNYNRAYRLSEADFVPDLYRKDMQLLGELLIFHAQAQALLFDNGVVNPGFTTPEFIASIPALREKTLSEGEKAKLLALTSLWSRGELIQALNAARALTVVNSSDGANDIPMTELGRRFITAKLAHYQGTVREYDEILQQSKGVEAVSFCLSLDPVRDGFFVEQMYADTVELSSMLERQARANVDYARQVLAAYDKKWGVKQKKMRDTKIESNIHKAKQAARKQMLIDIYEKVASAHRHNQLDNKSLLRRLNREWVALYFAPGGAAFLAEQPLLPLRQENAP